MHLKKIRLKIIPKPTDGTATVFTKGDNPNKEAFIKSVDGSYKFVCGFCDQVLAEKVEFSQIQDIVFECPRCKKYNISNPSIH